MMRNKLLANKKIVIMAIVLFVAVCVGAVILITSSPKETGGKNTNTKAEQEKEDEDDVEGAETDIDKNNKEDSNPKNNGEGLQVLSPNEIATDDSSDASGSWGDTTDKTEQTEDNNPNEADKENEEPEKDEDILEDDITWGDIY